NTLASARTVSVRLPAEETRALLDDVHRAYRTRINDLLLAALAQAIGRFKGTETLLLDLEGHGREPLAEAVDLSRTVGWFTTLYPVLLECLDDAGEQIKAVKERLRAVPADGIGYGLLRYLNPETAERLREQPSAPLVFNYLGQFDAALSSSSSLRPAAEGAGPMVGAAGWRRHLLEVNAVVARGCLQLNWTYSENLYRRSTIEALAAGFLEALEGLIGHCLSPAAGGLTPSDVPEAGLSQTEVDQLLADLGGMEAGLPESFYPLSPAQQGMLFFSLVQREPSNLFINQMHCVLRGNLDPERFRAAWQRVVDRHAILRTSVVWEGRERPLQVVRPQVEPPWVEEDWRHLPDAIRDDRLATLVEGDRYRGFDLSRAPLMRFTLVRTENQRVHFIWTMHQLILDGWSLQLLLAEVFACVRALAVGEEPQLPPPVPYREYIAWIERQDPQAAEEFWRRRLAGFEQATSLGVERRFGPGRAGERLSRQLAPPLRERLEALTRRQQLTLNTVIQGAWTLLLHRYSGHREVSFGAVVAGRPAEIADYESLVGLCINVLPVLVRVAPDAALAGWLSGIQADQAELRQFEHCPVEEIQRWLELPWNQPLFENLFIFENYPVAAGTQAAGGAELSVEEAGMEEAPNYPLNLFVLPGEPLELRLVYDTGRFDEPTVERLLVHLVRLLEEISQDPQRRLVELSLLLPGEREHVLSVLAT
ncbi:MAG: non-ribosomal peptide synthetase, partial [bacterium]|nr:non-ribosomal peptide synthetase [bacterium]